MRLLPLLLVLALTSTACAPKSSNVIASPTPAKTASKGIGMKMTKTMVTGLDPYDEDHVLVINTSDGSFVIGPEVPDSVKSVVHEQLVKKHNEIIIRYEEMEATASTLAHKRVRGLTINEAEYVFD